MSRPDGRFATTLAYRQRAAWMARADVVAVDDAGAPAAVVRIVRAARQRGAAVLNGSLRRDQLAAAALARLPRPPLTVLADATWKAGASSRERRARRVTVRALDHPRAHYCVLSNAEREHFPDTWGIPLERVHVTPFHWVLPEQDVADAAPGGVGVFAGGNSLRDYGPLLAAAETVDAPVTIATAADLGRDLPSNVTAGPVSPRRYDELLRQAAVVVVPLEPRADRSAGQQNYLNAMALGKPVVVTDALGVREYVDDRHTGVIVPPGDPNALGGALRRLLDPARRAETRALGDRARAAALERFGPEAYVERLLAVVDAARAAGA